MTTVELELEMDAPPQAQEKERKCLHCRDEFTSRWNGERVVCGGDKLVHGSGRTGRLRAEQNSATCSLRSFLGWKVGGCTPWTSIGGFGWPATLKG